MHGGGADVEPFLRDEALDGILRVRTERLAEDASKYASVVADMEEQKRREKYKMATRAKAAFSRDFNLGPDDLMYLRRAPSGAAIDVHSFIRTNGKLGQFLGFSFAAPLMAIGVDVEKIKQNGNGSVGSSRAALQDRSSWSGWARMYVGGDITCASSICATFQSILAEEQISKKSPETSKADPWVTRSCTFCTYNVFRGHDVRVSVEIPGKTSIEIVDGASSEVISKKESDVIWEEVSASRTLRTMRYLNKRREATHPFADDVPKVHFMVDPLRLSKENEDVFLALARRLFWASTKCCADSRVPCIAEGAVCNELAVGVYRHLTRKQRHAEAAKFLLPFMPHEPLLSVFAAAAARRGENCDIVKSMRGLVRAVESAKGKYGSPAELYPPSAAIMAAQADALLSIDDEKAKLALDVACNVVQCRPDVAGAWFLLARTHAATSNYRDALVALSHCAQRCIDNDAASSAVEWTIDFAHPGEISIAGSGSDMCIDAIRSRTYPPAAIYPRGAMRDCYTLLVKIEESIGWEALLDVRDSVFLGYSRAEDESTSTPEKNASRKQSRADEKEFSSPKGTTSVRKKLEDMKETCVRMNCIKEACTVSAELKESVWREAGLEIPNRSIINDAERVCQDVLEILERHFPGGPSCGKLPFSIMPSAASPRATLEGLPMKHNVELTALTTRKFNQIAFEFARCAMHHYICPFVSHPFAEIACIAAAFVVLSTMAEAWSEDDTVPKKEWKAYAPEFRVYREEATVSRVLRVAGIDNISSAKTWVLSELRDVAKSEANGDGLLTLDHSNTGEQIICAYVLAEMMERHPSGWGVLQLLPYALASGCDASSTLINMDAFVRGASGSEEVAFARELNATFRPAFGTFEKWTRGSPMLLNRKESSKAIVTENRRWVCSPLLEQMLIALYDDLSTYQSWERDEDGNVSEDPDNNDWYPRGLLCCRVGRYKDACLLFERAMQQDPSNISIRLGMLWLHAHARGVYNGAVGPEDYLGRVSYDLFCLGATKDIVVDETMQDAFLLRIAQCGISTFEKCIQNVAESLPESHENDDWYAWVRTRCIQYAKERKTRGWNK